jgi:hypothetical protein
MKMNSLKISAIILLLGIIAGACETLTEPGKDNQYTYERVIKDPSFTEGLLTYAYYRTQTSYVFDEVATDDAVTNENGNIYRRMATGEWSPQFFPSLTMGQSDWATAYTAIYNLNYFLSVVKDVEWSRLDAARNNRFIKLFTGEAHAMRAYWYTWLLIRYGGKASDNSLLGVPVVTDPIGIDDQWNIQRSTYQQTLDQIYADFKVAIDSLPAEYVDLPNQPDYNRVFGAIHRNRLSQNGAVALKIRATLHAASPAYNDGSYDLVKCDSVAAMASRLLKLKYTSNPIAGMPADPVFWDNDNDISNTDIIWRNNYPSNNNTLEVANYPPTLFGNGRINPSQNFVEAFPARDGLPIASSPLYDPAAPYANRDLRMDKVVVRNGASMRSTTINTAVDSPTDDGLNRKATFSTRTGYYMLKFLRTTINLNPAGTIGTARHFYTHVRGTEIYLAFAEAVNEVYGPDGGPYGFTARQVIGAIRKRAGITQTGTNTDAYLDGITTTDQMRELIRNERRLELCFEGQRFWDIRRWNLDISEDARGVSISGTAPDLVYAPINVEIREFGPHAIYGPIPFTEVIKYQGMLQNMGWQ